MSVMATCQSLTATEPAGAGRLLGPPGVTFTEWNHVPKRHGAQIRPERPFVNPALVADTRSCIFLYDECSIPSPKLDYPLEHLVWHPSLHPIDISFFLRKAQL